MKWLSLGLDENVMIDDYNHCLYPDICPFCTNPGPGPCPASFAGTMRTTWTRSTGHRGLHEAVMSPGDRVKRTYCIRMNR